jgi:cell wall-associated NlpC family hydrolase
MNKIQAAIDFAVKIANDNSHGYAQDKRGGNPDYDCSSLIISAWESAGVKVKEAGATFTGNMRLAFKKCNFDDVIKLVDLTTGCNMLAGDVLLHENHHVAMYLGNGKIVHASINEKGKITGGQAGDQTGREICVRSYYNHPWNSVLRYDNMNDLIDQVPAEIIHDKDYWKDRLVDDYGLISTCSTRQLIRNLVNYLESKEVKK